MRQQPLNEFRVLAGLSRLLAPLAPSCVAAVRNSVSILRVWASDRGWWPLKAPPELRLSYLGEEFRLFVATRSELEVVREMFLSEEYLMQDLDPELVIDLGSNIGASIMFFRGRYPKSRIIGLEPDPAPFQRLMRAVTPLQGVSVYPWAIADRTGQRAFTQAAQSWVSALAAEGDVGTVDVEAISLPDLLRRLGVDHVDLLKIDVEGGEWGLFRDPGNFDACDAIVGELHLEPPDRTVDKAREALSAFTVSVYNTRVDRTNFRARRKACR